MGRGDRGEVTGMGCVKGLEVTAQSEEGGNECPMAGCWEEEERVGE